MKSVLHFLCMAVLAFNLGSSQHMAKFVPDGTLTSLALHSPPRQSPGADYELPSPSQSPLRGKVPNFRSVRPVMPFAAVSSVPRLCDGNAPSMQARPCHIPSCPIDDIFHPPA
jgi:hypothetical protein